MFNKLLFFIKHASFSTMLVILTSAVAIIGGTAVTAIVIAEHDKQPSSNAIESDGSTPAQSDEEPNESVEEPANTQDE